MNTTNTPAIAPLSAAELDKLEALARVAKASTWTAVKHNWSNVGIYSAGRPVACLSIADDALEETQEMLEAEMDADAEFLMAACNTLPSLIAQARLAAQPVVGKSELMRKALEKYVAFAKSRRDELGELSPEMEAVDAKARAALAAPVAAQADTIEQSEKAADQGGLAEGAALLAALFKVLTLKQKNSVLPEFAAQLGRFMFRNGYRVVFNDWYLQAKPDRAPATSAGEADTTASVSPAAQAVEALTPLDYRAQGREEALAIILAESAENPFSDYTGWARSRAPDDEGGAYWKEDELRKALHIGDRKHDAYDRAEAAYWQALGEKDEAKRELLFVRQAPFYEPLHDFLAKHEAWDLMGDLKRASAAAQAQQAAPAATVLENIQGVSCIDAILPVGTKLYAAPVAAAAPVSQAVEQPADDAEDARAIQFALELAEHENDDAAISFLKAWNNEDAGYLRSNWPDFDAAMLANKQEGDK